PNTSFAQKIIHVPADVPNIQTAVFSAQNGDTVLVAPGVYFESIAFQGRNITVMSSNGAAVTTVDSGSQPSAQFFDNENNGAVLKGFTFVNGSGIQISSASPIIEDNIIANNQGCQAGGIMVSNGSPIIQRNTISNNRQFCTGAPAAGGIFVDGQGSVQILNNTISGNQTAPGVQAGGIFIDAFGTTTITGNKIQNNVTDSAGGGIYANGSNVIIADNLITGNSASTGGGIQIAPGSNAILVNNTVALNQAQQGAQLALDGMAGTVSLFNNVFYDLTGNGAIFCSMTGFTGFPPAQNNDAISFAGDPAGPLAVAYTGSCSDQTGFNGNVQAAPQFTDPINGDFHLVATSPLIDAGNSAAPNLPAQDLDGNPRIAAGSNLCLPLVDIGAYEIVFNSVGSASMGTSSLLFGEWPIGVQNFFTLPVTLTGTQGCTQITSITTSSDYQQTSKCSVLRAGDSCTIQVTFAPKIAGLRMGTLKVNLLSPPATLTAELSGTGLNSATVNPVELNFGIQAIQTTQFQSVNVSSTGGQPLGVSSVTVTGDFQQFSNCTQFSSNTCFISVQFTPTVAGPRTGMLTVVSNLGTFAVPLSGDGAAPASSFSPTSLSFPTQTVGTASTPQPITLTNNGTANLLWNSVISTPDFQ
ncbi:MAG TPA: choice-of-anchor D domain-containing protein, partial [Candidatus Angelobacter sp.]